MALVYMFHKINLFKLIPMNAQTQKKDSNNDANSADNVKDMGTSPSRVQLSVITKLTCLRS